MNEQVRMKRNKKHFNKCYFLVILPVPFRKSNGPYVARSHSLTTLRHSKIDFILSVIPEHQRSYMHQRVDLRATECRFHSPRDVSGYS